MASIMASCESIWLLKLLIGLDGVPPGAMRRTAGPEQPGELLSPAATPCAFTPHGSHHEGN
jgi:hypothetical protein